MQDRKRKKWRERERDRTRHSLREVYRLVVDLRYNILSFSSSPLHKNKSSISPIDGSGIIIQSDRDKEI